VQQLLQTFDQFLQIFNNLRQAAFVNLLINKQSNDKQQLSYNNTATDIFQLTNEQI